MKFDFDKEKLKENFNKATTNVKQKVEEVKVVTTEKVIPGVKEKINDVGEFTNSKIIPKTKEVSTNVKNKNVEVTKKVTDKAKETLTEEQMIEILDKLYINSVNGIPKVSLPVDDLVNDYISKNKDVESAAKSLIKVSMVKCGTSGFLSGLGGLGTIILTLPANLTSVMYVQLRMCVAIAKMGGYDIHSDQVQTLIYACLTGSAASNILKNAGVKFGEKFSNAMIKKIPGAVLTKINQKVGFRFVTKFGEKGIINMVELVPVVGGAIGGGIDVTSTKVIGYNAFKIFIQGELPTKDIEKDIVLDCEYEEINDVDTKMIDVEMMK